MSTVDELVAKCKKERNEQLGATLVQRLKNRGFDAWYCATKDEALQQALALIPKDHPVSWGGSVTIGEIGLQQYCREHYKVIDRDTAKTPEERVELMRQALLCDTFLTSANAMTADGELVYIDGNGNRTAAILYGPRQVIAVIGLNKVCKTLPAALDRAHMTAAVINGKRFPGGATPCQKTGVCFDCNMADTMCNYILTIRRSKPIGKIKVILVGEEVGF